MASEFYDFYVSGIGWSSLEFGGLDFDIWVGLGQNQLWQVKCDWYLECTIYEALKGVKFSHKFWVYSMLLLGLWRIQATRKNQNL